MEDSDTVATQRPDLIRPRVVLTIGGVTCVLCKRELQAAVAAGDGYSYCRPCILDWFRAHERDGSQVSSPVTGEALSDKLLLPNLNLRETILSVQQALKTWDEAEAERTSLRAEVQKLLGEGHSRKLQNVDPRVAEAQAQAAHFERQVLNQKQEVQRLQMELDRYHHVMEERDFSGLDAKAAELSLVAAELRSSMVEVNRLEDELEKTRQQAKLQATELEELRTSQRDAFFTEQMLRQELARVKDEFSGKLTVGGAKDHSFELNKARHELLKSQVLVVDLQNQLRAARREPPAPSSPKALEIPQENQFQSELFEMKGMRGASEFDDGIWERWGILMERIRTNDQWPSSNQCKREPIPETPAFHLGPTSCDGLGEANQNLQRPAGFWAAIALQAGQPRGGVANADHGLALAEQAPPFCFVHHVGGKMWKEADGP
ncbi:unnamed protein product [Durusdinium trenchii]|uniref:Uncharacterized protein n=1 Tax=Durusdinium trenchii TaxID=1381693 RepID=A0ABP0H9A5_9DINO